MPRGELQELRRRVRHLAFDLDGTLTDSARAIALNYQAVFRRFSLPEPPADRVYPLIGLPLDDVLRRLSPQGAAASPEEVSAWRACYRAIYDEVALPETALFPGVRETLRRCVEAGYTVNLATSKQRGQAAHVLEHCGIRDLFTVVAGGDVAPRPKPHPDMLLWLVGRLGCRPGELLMVGDTTFDLDMGRAAGTWSCGVTYGVHSRAALELCHPDALLDRIEGVLDLLGAG